MKRKLFLFLGIFVSVLLISALAYYIYIESKTYDLEYLEIEEFNDVEYDVDLILGKWKSGTVYYRFDEDGLGATWDVADDIFEEEASSFKWDIDHSRFVHYHKMHNGVIIPKVYKISSLDLNTFIFIDDYGNEHLFLKVIE